jgi:DNA-binding transcriptional ArsR family regulator
MSDPEFPIPTEALRQAVLTLRAVNHPLRQQLLSLLRRRGPLTVTDIYISLRLQQSAASQQLSILRQAGLLTRSRRGKFILYALNEERLETLTSALRQLSETFPSPEEGTSE